MDPELAKFSSYLLVVVTVCIPRTCDANATVVVMLHGILPDLLTSPT